MFSVPKVRIRIFLFILLFFIISTVLSKGAKKIPCERWQSEPLKNAYKNEKGNIISDGIEYTKDEVFPDIDPAIQDYNDNNNNENMNDLTKMRVCPCLRHSCIRKCCPKEQSYLRNNRTGGKVLCQQDVNGGSLFDQLQFHSIDSETDEDPKIVGRTGDQVFISNEIKDYCVNKRMYPLSNDEFYLLINGSLLQKTSSYPMYVLKTIEDYCVDLLNGDLKFLMCAQKSSASRVEASRIIPRKDKEARLWIYPICMLTSLPFLTATCLLYCFIPDLNNLVGKSLSSLTFTRIFASFPLMLIQVFRYTNFSCIILGYLVQYSILSNFFWLNVMCFDIWLVFSGLSTPYRNLTKNKEWRKFLKYAAYAWGMPILICFATYLAEYLPTDSNFRPGVGESYCLLLKNYSRVLFYFGPLTIILIANVLMFSATAYKIFEHKKEMKVLKADGNSINNNVLEKERLNLYFKLFLVMGITWIAEPISEFFNEEPDWLWILLDSINLLQGIPIFIIFVCKRRTLRAINAKLCPSKQFFGSSRRESSNTRPRRTLTSTSSLTSCCPKNSVSITPNKQSNDLEMVPKEKSSKSYNVAVIA